MPKPTAAQKRHFGVVAELGCVVCWREHGEWTPASIHHARSGCGLSQRDHDRVIPLCLDHHQGIKGIHQGQKSWEAEYGTEEELLEAVNNQL